MGIRTQAMIKNLASRERKTTPFKQEETKYGRRTALGYFLDFTCNKGKITSEKYLLLVPVSTLVSVGGF